MELTHIPIEWSQTEIEKITERYCNGEMGWEELIDELNKFDLSAAQHLQLLIDISSKLKEG